MTDTQLLTLKIVLGITIGFAIAYFVNRLYFARLGQVNPAKGPHANQRVATGGIAVKFFVDGAAVLLAYFLSGDAWFMLACTFGLVVLGNVHLYQLTAKGGN